MLGDTDISSKRAILLANNSLQTNLLKDSIEGRVSLNITLISPKKLQQYRIEAMSTDVEYVIIDYSSLDESNLSKYLEFIDSNIGNSKEVLLNTPSNLAHTDMLKWPNLVGVFYDTDTVETLVNGFQSIMGGELWMSRKLLYEYVHFYRRRQCTKTNPYYSKLTKREQEIIKLLGDGVSNTEIANALFVSENTVKAHLHNTFKKIRVKNRVQALLWVKHNVAASELA